MLIPNLDLNHKNPFTWGFEGGRLYLHITRHNYRLIERSSFHNRFPICDDDLTVRFCARWKCMHKRNFLLLHFNSKIVLLNCDWTHSLSLSLIKSPRTLSYTNTHTHECIFSLNFFRRSILTLHIFNSQTLSRIARTTEFVSQYQYQYLVGMGERERERESVCKLSGNCGNAWRLFIACWIQVRIYFSARGSVSYEH